MLTSSLPSKLIWFPILAALVAGGLGYGLGYWSGGSGWFVAFVCAMLAWVWSSMYWQGIIRIAYTPLKPVAEIVEEMTPPEDTSDPLEKVYEVKCDSLPTSTHYIRGLTLDQVYDLHTYAVGVSEGKRSTYRDWMKPAGPFDEPQFKAIRDWLLENRWGLVTADKTPIKLNDLGRHLLSDIAVFGITDPSPTHESAYVPVYRKGALQ